ncbi:hypothetical protein ANCDUO_17545 [Ancylostoma duodenale]|uniref:Uncharacterized protein n=1 Tax=Ancylostoma duodenale TaxID=51022 RepID=A0A0C2G0D3_9BILA|nr:hypothetical protein ANCDUO_17545 [Ancylostoma duodenale]
MRKLVIPKYYGRPSIGLALFGCANRPFYHICVFPDKALGRRFEGNIVEQTFVRARHNRENKIEEKVGGDTEEETSSKKQASA